MNSMIFRAESIYEFPIMADIFTECLGIIGDDINIIEGDII